MSIKSLIQRFFGDPTKPTDLAGIVRLQGRSDWGPSLYDDPSAPAPWDRYPAFSRPTDPSPGKWPATDDPYAAPEPCPIVPDPALEKLGDLRVQALTWPMDSVKSVTDLLQLIQRQEAAEKLVIQLGWEWDGVSWVNHETKTFF